MFCTAIRHADRKDYDFLENKLKESKIKSSSSKYDAHILKGLGCTNDLWRLGKYIQNENLLDVPDLASLIAINNPSSIYFAWSLIKSKWSLLVTSKSESSLTALLTSFIKKFNTIDQYNDVYCFLFNT